jgi:hypothetical protein
MAGDDKCVYLFRSPCTLLGTTGIKYAALRQKTVAYIGPSINGTSSANLYDIAQYIEVNEHGR